MSAAEPPDDEHSRTAEQRLALGHIALEELRRDYDREIEISRDSNQSFGSSYQLLFSIAGLNGYSIVSLSRDPNALIAFLVAVSLALAMVAFFFFVRTYQLDEFYFIVDPSAQFRNMTQRDQWASQDDQDVRYPEAQWDLVESYAFMYAEAASRNRKYNKIRSLRRRRGLRCAFISVSVAATGAIWLIFF